MQEKEHTTDLFTLHKDKIYNLSYQMTGSANLAMDITQETFLRFYETKDKFRGDSKISTWLYAMAKNICLQHLKNEKRTKVEELRRLQELAQDSNIDHYSESETTIYINQVREGCLLGLLRTLSLNQRLAFILFILHGFPIESTAKVLNKSVSATRTLIHRARKNIKNFVCENCIHYNNQNHCRCEGMINFSLKMGWINYDEKYYSDLPETIKSELSDLRKITALYESLPTHEIPSTVFNELQQNNYLIFSDKKVK
jgi:RNA polymerase sigma factor (sigma-70 family)